MILKFICSGAYHFLCFFLQLISMKEIYNKQLLDTFSDRLKDQFEDFCEQQSMLPSNDLLITYIIDKSLIPPVTLQHFTIIATFNELQAQQKMTKTQIVQVLANRFNLSQRSIWNILAKQKMSSKK